VLDYLALRGCFAWRNNTGRYVVDGRHISYGFVGSSDVLGVAPDGRFIGVECKTAAGTLKPAQVEFMQQVNARGGVAIVVRPDDYVELIERVLSEEAGCRG
jgi:hypothetical protein